MPIYVLGARNPRVQIPNQPLAVSISGSVQHARLVVHASPEQRVMRPNPHLAVLPEIGEPVSIGVACVSGAVEFGAETFVNLAIGHDTPGELDPVQVFFEPVDVGSETGVQLATLTPHAGGIEVSAGAAADTALSPLASAARTSARKAIDRDTRAPRAPVLLALDASASMAPHFADGSAAAAAEIVVGVADALGLLDVSAVLVGEDVRPVNHAGTAGLGEAVTQADPRWCAGARWSRLPEVGCSTIVCSDFPTGVAAQRCPMLAISSDTRLDADGARIPPPHHGGEAGAALLADSAALDRITAALVRALT